MVRFSEINEDHLDVSKPCKTEIFLQDTATHGISNARFFSEPKVSATEIEVALEWLLCRPCEQSLWHKACNFGVATCHCLRYQTGFQALCQVQSIQSGTFFATRAPYLHFQLHIACRLLKLQQSRAQHASKIRRLVGWKNGCGGDVSKGAMLLNNHHLHC